MFEQIDHLFMTSKMGNVYRSVINRTEKILIEKALEQSAGNKIVAAKFLGLNRNTLHAKIRMLRIDVRRFKT